MLNQQINSFRNFAHHTINCVVRLSNTLYTTKLFIFNSRYAKHRLTPAMQTPPITFLILLRILFSILLSTVQSTDTFASSLEFPDPPRPIGESVSPRVRSGHSLDWESVDRVQIVGDDGFIDRPPVFPIVDRPAPTPHEIAAHETIKQRERHRREQLDILEDTTQISGWGLSFILIRFFFYQF